MSEVDIGNMALAFLGDEATVTAITPPEGSVQAERVAQFYPVARDIVLENHPFFTKRGALTLRSGETYNGWQYAYDRPTDCLKFFAVLPPEAGDEYSLGYPQSGTQVASNGGYVELSAGYNTYTPVPFRQELSADNRRIILTNMPEAYGRWSVRVTDTALFSPTCKIAIAKLLASLIAGPIYKGTEGAQLSAALLQHYQVFMAQASMIAASETREEVRVSTPWIAGR